MKKGKTFWYAITYNMFEHITYINQIQNAEMQIQNVWRKTLSTVKQEEINWTMK